jgi:hypothetical protein
VRRQSRFEIAAESQLTGDRVAAGADARGYSDEGQIPRRPNQLAMDLALAIECLLERAS